MKIILTLLCVVGFGLFQMKQDVEVIYCNHLPAALEQLTYFKQIGKDPLDRTESIMKEAEKILIQQAKQHNFKIIEIFILDKSNGEIPTESQIGQIGHISLYFRLRNN